MTDFAWDDIETFHRDVERQREQEARLLPQEFQMFEYFTPEGETTAEERQKQDGNTNV